MDCDQIHNLVHQLNDVELALLLSLVAEGHCILTTDDGWVDPLQTEVEVIGANGFGLHTVTVQCTEEMSVDDFVGKLLVNEQQVQYRQGRPLDADSYFNFRRQSQVASSSIEASGGYGKHIANMIVIRNLDVASLKIQAQILELMRMKHILTKRHTLTAPSQFLIVALLAKTHTRPALLGHLLEQFFISHYRVPEQAIDNDYPRYKQSDSESQTSVIHKPSVTMPVALSFHASGKVLLPIAVINSIREYAKDVTISTEIRRYLLDIVTHLRMHRAVKGGGVSAKATADFELLVKCLAPLHNLDFATPALVSLAVFKVYSHKIELVQKAKDERSILWGSSPATVEAYLRHVDVEMVIEDVLSAVRAPM